MINKLKLPGLIIFLFLSGCAYLPDWFGEELKEKLPGERISILPKYVPTIEPEEKAKEFSIVIPAETSNKDFSEISQPADNVAIGSNLKIKETLELAGGNDYILTFPPLIQDNRLFTLDGKGIVSVFDLSNLKKLWSKKINESENYFLGGGLAYENNFIYATSSTGDVVSYKADSGEELWRRKFDSPIKSPPAVKNNIVVIKNSNNEAYGISAADGKLLWNYAGLVEDVSIIGSAPPVIHENTVILPFSSGEVFAVNLNDGEPLWSDSLITKARGISSTLFISDIDAVPVIRDKIVYVGSSQNLFTAKDLSTGKSIWEAKISITKTPWIAGDFIYLITAQDELAAIRKADGSIKWVKQLKRFEDENNNTGKISYTAPIMAGSNLIIISSDGKLNFFSPENGENIRKTSINENINLRPAISEGKIYTLSNDGILTILE